MHDAAEADVRPDDRRLRVALEQGDHLLQVDRLGVLLGKRHVDVVVQDDDEAGLGGEGEDAIQRRVGQAGGLARDLRADELLVDAELADAGEDAGKRRQDAADVIDAVHVGRVETGDHRIEARLLLRPKAAIDAGDVGVRERVVVERRVGVQVVGRREVAGVGVGPVLLQRDAEQRRAGDARAHDVEELGDVDALLDVVGQVEMRVVEPVGAGRSLGDERARPPDREHQQRHGQEGPEGDGRTG